MPKEKKSECAENHTTFSQIVYPLLFTVCLYPVAECALGKRRAALMTACDSTSMAVKSKNGWHLALLRRIFGCSPQFEQIGVVAKARDNTKKL